MSLHLGPATCRDLAASLQHEWLETNGMGGYALSTLHHCNTRKYHGLLVAALAQPAGRFVLLSKLEDTLCAGADEIPLSCNQYPGVLHPNGHENLSEFHLDATGPEFLYTIGDIRLRKHLLMVQGENTILIRYELEHSSVPVSLRLAPFLAYRRHHEVKREDAYLRGTLADLPNGFSIAPYEGLPALAVQATRPVRRSPAPGYWTRRIEYRQEAERGYDFQEDCYVPTLLEFSLEPGSALTLCASVEVKQDIEGLWKEEWARRRRLIQRAEAAVKPIAATPVAKDLQELILGGRHFTIRQPGTDRHTIIAGYPWFDDWGRDTLISLPGLTFCSGDPQRGAEILKAVAPHEKDGLIPNCFAADPSQHAYNSIDASLLYFWAVQQFLEATHDQATVRNHLWPVLKRILSHFMAGTRFNTYMDAEGLLHAGNRHTQLTWMDATSRGEPVTPRHGYAVDLNALWYNAVCLAETLAREYNDPVPWEAGLTMRIKRSFERLFWMEEEHYLADSVSDGRRDRSLRPNQIFAVSLPFSPLDTAQQRAVVAAVQRDLLTPFGLRTLSPADPAYCGRYQGDQPTRDSQYHQGTVWPWLLGPFGEALLKVSPRPDEAARSLLTVIRPLLDYSLHGPGLMNIPEIYDGDPPQRANGCPAQAWSSAELIRLFALFGKACSV